MNILQLTTIGENAVFHGLSRDETRGGLEKIIIFLNKEISKRGHNVILSCCAKGIFFDEGRENNLDVRVIKSRWFKFLGKPLFPILSFTEVIRLVKQNKIDIIHCANFSAGFIGGLVAKLFRIPMVISEHQEISIKSYDIPQTLFKSFLLSIKHGIIMAMRKISALLAWKIICVSDLVRKDLLKKKFNGSKLVTIINSIELSCYNPSLSAEEIKKELLLDNGKFIVGAIGRLVQHKGFKYFIEALPKVQEVIPEVKFLIVGDGPEMNNLKNLVEYKMFQEKIVFTGYRDNIQQIYASLDVLVQPSLLEGFSGVLLEGMAMGKPVIATEACGDMNLFQHLENILIVEPTDSDAIANAIITLYEDKTLRQKIAQNGRNFVEKNFNVSLWLDKYLNIFSELVAGKKC